MDEAELDAFLARLISADGGAQGFVSAYVASYSPPTIEISFSDNAAAEMYAFSKQVQDVKGVAVSPPNSSTVIWLK